MERTPEPCIMVIFGATGDLTHRKLLPALYNLQRDKLLPAEFAVCAYARRDKDDESFRRDMNEGLRQHSRRTPEGDGSQLEQRTFYVRGELDDDAGYQRLKARLAELDERLGTRGNRLFYLAVASDRFHGIVERLARNGLIQPPAAGRPWMRVVLEKPIGFDLQSARKLMQALGDHVAEEQTYRIDHYLGKETVQNLLALRFGNGIFEPLWNRNYVDHVQITVAEIEGVGSRAGYYEKAGALRDVVQNHMMQLLCLVAMEAPGTMRADDIRNEKVKVLRNLRRLTDRTVKTDSVRGQYGPSADGRMIDYRSEPGVDPQSSTETFVALRCFVDTWRWAGVPFLLRTGKRLPRRATEISIHFQIPPLRLFGGYPEIGYCVGNVLTVEVQPDEGMSLEMLAKVPGAGMKLENMEMDFRYDKAFRRQMPEAYERLLLDVMSGDATLFGRNDEVEAQWEFIMSVLDGWAALPAPNFPNYFAGSWGPSEAPGLIPPCARGWHMEGKAAAAPILG